MQTGFPKDFLVLQNILLYKKSVQKLWIGMQDGVFLHDIKYSIIYKYGVVANKPESWYKIPFISKKHIFFITYILSPSTPSKTFVWIELTFWFMENTNDYKWVWFVWLGNCTHKLLGKNKHKLLFCDLYLM